MNCCRADAEVFAIAAQYTDIKSLRENQPIKVEGIIDSTQIYDKGKEYTIPLIIVNKLNWYKTYISGKLKWKNKWRR